VSDVTSEVGFWPFWLMLPGLRRNYYTEVFCSNFHWKLGYNLSLLKSEHRTLKDYCYFLDWLF